MARFVLLAIASLGLLATVRASFLKSAKRMARYEINLDIEPKLRFREFAKANCDDLAMLMTGLSLINAVGGRGMPPWDTPKWLKHHNFKQERLDEMRGIVDECHHPSVSMNNLIMFNLVYSTSTFKACSAVLAVDKDNHVVHGRNLDYSNIHYTVHGQKKDMQTMTAEMLFTRGGRPQYVSVGLLGFMGAHTAMKLTEPRWTFQQNTHHTNEQKENLAAAMEGGLDFGLFWRDILEEGEGVDYHAAIKRVQEANFNAPQYFILSGQEPWQGVSIEIQRGLQPAGEEMMVSLSEKDNKWFLIQTNDQIRQPPRDPRRPSGTFFMKTKGRDWIDKEHMLTTMRSFPIFNPETLWTFITVPATGYYQTVLRDDNREQGSNMTELMKGTEEEKTMLASVNMKIRTSH
eukprot:CAMPEP_0197877198 /NCGR_PEP_ID=MMETSP1439-20131203/5967_1 /TAXON_ID=66791 /ORGANISM="Gonyaulax spinifera, Strain CCMP409" /LENGTH=402 /DNA_ID=CAMNT_0043496529 /DNA_START=69 /DNA_END=1277 /DNA_ORIENTATION=+